MDKLFYIQRGYNWKQRQIFLSMLRMPSGRIVIIWSDITPWVWATIHVGMSKLIRDFAIYLPTWLSHSVDASLRWKEMDKLLREKKRYTDCSESTRTIWVSLDYFLLVPNFQILSKSFNFISHKSDSIMSSSDLFRILDTCLKIISFFSDIL